MELRIKDVCREKGITQKELAGLLGVSEMTLSRASKGNTSLDLLDSRCIGSGAFRPSTDEHDHLPALRQTYQSGERGIKITPGLRAYTNVRKSAFYLRVLL